MGTLTIETVSAFCQHCDWSFQSWTFRRTLYDDNPDAELLKDPSHAHFFLLLSKIVQEYWLHEVVKLNDPPVQRSSKNLTVDLIYETGKWTDDVTEDLRNLRDDLIEFSSQLTSARNKLLSHKDLDVILSGASLGYFDKGADERYFQSLQHFANIVHDEYIGGPYPFDDLVTNDVAVFMAAFSKGAA